MKLQDRTALVTGAASGLGREIARVFAREGAKVAIADLDGDAAKAAAGQIRAAGGEAIGIAMDVTSEAAVDDGVSSIVRDFGGVDILVSNAGIQIVKAIEAFSFTEWRRMMAIHLDGAFLTTRACLPHMYAAGRGSIIYMGSAHSKESSPMKAPYVAAKHALIGLAKAVAKEAGPRGVRTNVVCPGFVRTQLVDSQISDLAQKLGTSEDEVARKFFLNTTVDGEFTTVEDVAEIALMFASFPTNALTGQSLVVSHGWAMQ